MASISGATSSNAISSAMNSANKISGLASGLDTEGMIESLVQSYQTKIDKLNQKVTKTEWKQEAYRSIIDKMVSFSNKYTSYSSATNLMSPSFFNNAVKVAVQGLHADKVAASGKTSSDIALNAVHQLATSAQYRTSSNLKAGDGKSIQAEAGIDLNGQTTLGSLNGTLTLTYGSNNISLSFDEVADAEAVEEIRTKLGKNASESEVLAELINQKLADKTISFSGGSSSAATDRISVKADGLGISIADKSNAGNSVYFSKASGNVANALGLDLTDASTKKPSEIGLSPYFKTTKKVDNADYLSGKIMNLSLDGTTKQIKLPTINKDSSGNYQILDADGNTHAYNAENYTKVLNESLDKVFKGKVKAENLADDGSLQLSFKPQEGSDLVINTDVGETLGIGRAATSYLNTSKTLDDLLDLDDSYALKDKDGKFVLDDKGNKQYEFKINDTVIGTYTKDTKLSELMNDINSNKEAGVKVSYSQTTKNFLFSATETGADSEVKMGAGLAQAMFGSTEINGASGKFSDAYGLGGMEPTDTTRVKFNIDGLGGSLEIDISGDDTIEDVANKLNQSGIANRGYTASYNKYTGQMEITSESGAKIDFTMEDAAGFSMEFDKNYAPAISYTPGQDAKFTVTVNGEQIDMTRSSNTVSIDGLSITMKDTFDTSLDENGEPTLDSSGNRVYKASNAVTFETSTDSDKIVDAIKTMIEDYNAMMSEIKSAYSTMPYQTSSGSFANYEPLTESDMEGMSESAIERYEAKAKQGILFGDRNLSTLYNKLRNVFSPAGEDGAYLRAMGITTSFTIGTGAEAVTLDEDKLRAMLDSDPDIVANVFTRTDNGGGVMQSMKTQLDAYAKTTGEPKGILVQQSGTPLSSLSLLSNTWQTEIDNYTSQIETWQDKLTTQVERYTSQFTRLEQLINQMNSQSSALAGMLGG